MLVQPEKTSDNLATYMGAFWALTGVVTIRSSLAGQRTRGIPLVSGSAGVVAGLVVFFHERLDNVVAQSVLVWLLATVILLTGLAHMLEGFRAGDELEHQPSRSSVLLGMMEIPLGLLLLVGSLENSRAGYWAACIWAHTGAPSSSPTRSYFGVDSVAKAGGTRLAPKALRGRHGSGVDAHSVRTAPDVHRRPAPRNRLTSGAAFTGGLSRTPPGRVRRPRH
jgi:uncharacterized membrane protein HdeD (DUF308 family)